MRFHRCILILLSILLLPPATFAAETKEGPTGYGKASFGTTVEEVQKAYPGLEKLEENQSLGAPVVGGPFITNYALRDQTVPGLQKPAQVELRFWKGKFWLYIVYFDKGDFDSLVAHLKGEYGDQSKPDSKVPIWNFPKSTLMVDGKQSRYTINDNDLSNEARAWFIEGLKQSYKGQNVEVVDNTGKTPSPAPSESPSPETGQP